MCKLSLVLPLFAMASAAVFAQTTPAAGAVTDPASQNGSQPPYLNPSLPIDQRVDDLVGRMTLAEKASQVLNQSRPISRLNVPAYDWCSEALHGVAFAGTATVIPEPRGATARASGTPVQQVILKHPGDLFTKDVPLRQNDVLLMVRKL